MNECIYQKIRRNAEQPGTWVILLLSMAVGPFVSLTKGMLLFSCTSGCKHEALYVVQSMRACDLVL